MMNDSEHVKRTRNRRINTCLECRRLKRKCSRTYPCLHCQKTSRECIFPVVKQTTSSTPHDGSGTSVSQPDTTLDPPTGMPAEFSIPYESPRSTKNYYRKPPDICLRLGKLSITERIGGVLRVDFVQSIEDLLQEPPGVRAGIDSQFSAPLVAWFKPHSVLPLDQLFSQSGVTPEAFPLSELQEQTLINQYFVAVHPVCPLVSMVDLEDGAILSTALRAAVFYAAAVSFPLLQSQRSFGITKDALVNKLKTLAEAEICKADILSCLDLQIFQVVLIYLTPQLLTEVSRSHSVFIGTVIRHFQIAGFDRECAADTSLERRMKRHLWQHLLFLNIRAVEAVGPEHTVIDDPSSLLPEHDEFVLPQSSGSSNPTYIVALVRYECYRIHRWIFRKREPLKKGEVSLQSLLDELSQATMSIYARYIDHLNDNIPIQKYASLVGKLLLARAEGMLLGSQRHKWEFPETALGLRDRDDFADSRGTRVIRACLEVLETAVTIETDPELSQWAWYAGAYQQYHSMLFPLAALHQAPHLPDADRIMAMADHVFGPSPTTSPRERSQMILRAIKNNMAAFLATIDPTRPDIAHLQAPLPFQPPNSRNNSYPDLIHEPPTTGVMESVTRAVPQHAMMDDQQYFYNNSNNFFNISPPALEGVAADAWWKWPPQMDQDDLFRELNIF